MSRLAVAVFDSPESARQARRELDRRGAEPPRAESHLELDQVRLHQGAVDPLLAVDLKSTARQIGTDRMLLGRSLLPLGLGVIGGFVLGELIGAVDVRAPVLGAVTLDTAGWLLLGAIAGLAVSVVLVFSGHQPGNRRRVFRELHAALDRGDVALSVRFAPSSQAAVAGVLRRHGGTFQRLV